MLVHVTGGCGWHSEREYSFRRRLLIANIYQVSIKRERVETVGSFGIIVLVMFDRGSALIESRCQSLLVSDSWANVQSLDTASALRSPERREVINNFREARRAHYYQRALSTFVERKVHRSSIKIPPRTLTNKVVERRLLWHTSFREVYY